jgi:hypothetical protein
VASSVVGADVMDPKEIYTSCQDYEPHEEHKLEMQDDVVVYCIGHD